MKLRDSFALWGKRLLGESWGLDEIVELTRRNQIFQIDLTCEIGLVEDDELPSIASRHAIYAAYGLGRRALLSQVLCTPGSEDE